MRVTSKCLENGNVEATRWGRCWEVSFRIVEASSRSGEWGVRREGGNQAIVVV